MSARKQKWIFENYQSPGDIVMLTAAVRDLHQCHPGEFVTDVRSSCPDLWKHNPYLTPLDASAADVKVLKCHYPLIHCSNQEPVHFLHGFIDYFNQQLGARIKPTLFKGDIHLSAEEKSGASPVRQLVGCDVPYWIVAAGGKYDYTIKWWHFRRYQAVVDHFRGRILFVQVGQHGHYHPGLDGVLDLRGRTNLRQLIQLIHHARGVVCPVTALMHLSAAVETKPGVPPQRPCVVIAGGREAPHWEAYPGHQFIHTVGSLPCCATGGCWRARTVALEDGDEKDRPEHLCVDVVRGLPRCMDLITPEDVIRRIQIYFDGGGLKFLSKAQARRARRFLAHRRRDPWL